ncbi:hypothetical protein LINPERHAP1_LOCUS21501, partial [Linum perenne]
MILNFHTKAFALLTVRLRGYLPFSKARYIMGPWWYGLPRMIKPYVPMRRSNLDNDVALR